MQQQQQQQFSSRIILGDSLVELPKLPVDSIDLCLTGPPFWRETWKTNPEIRWDDGWIGHLGAEPTIPMYIAHMVSIFDRVKRVLHPYFGSCWVVLQDIYRNHSQCMIPERFAIAMLYSGWVLRSHFISYGSPSRKGQSPPPQYYDVFFFTKSEQYPFRTQYNEPLQDKELRGLKVIYNHCRPDGIILDPFTGRGITAVAAQMAGRKFIGIELNEERRQITLQRIGTMIRNGY